MSRVCSRPKKRFWIVISDSTDEVISEVRAGVLEAAREHGHDYVLIENPDSIAHLLNITRPGKLKDIAIITDCHCRLPSAKPHWNVIVIDDGSARLSETAAGTMNICGDDDAAIGAMAAEYLHGQSRFKSFATATRYPVNAGTERRFAAFSGALRALSNLHPIHEIVIQGELPESEAENFSNRIATMPKPVGVFANDDASARNLLSLCARSSLKVPRDVAILGVGDTDPMNDQAKPGLSSIRLNRRHLGKSIMHVMMHTAQSMSCVSLRCPPERVIERESTAVREFKDKFVAKACEFISASPLFALRVSSVVKAVGVSRSYLEKRFRVQTGMTILNMIHKRILDATKTQLERNDRDLNAIANEVGYRSSSGLGTLFHKHFGISMREYRQRHHRGR